ncbi:peptide/nickel transport system ATP-binding protein/oligopeptide transport system ATP-binding protein/dipeptide transport system ATP-binding protein [Paraburkholderia susongensis]|uniref:Nickel import system ATP-binding protein NikD n=2 Tax=Paraburkholderia susongensis TaxID=1515439 RepID=A0A1X7LIZ2_9BURK|nr:peptide/nickel transport system ATP-binding protein/oligopeptide transport system ATP-binding protein/dipeptide transport system ATP-binding protein [Paraburkholderia susongensis]
MNAPGALTMMNEMPAEAGTNPNAPAREKALLSIRGLRTCFDTSDGLVRAVDGVDLDVFPGECLGVVGESGSGKSVTFASVMGLVRAPGRIESGSIEFAGRELVGMSLKAMRRLRGKEIAMTMQDALAALNPALSVGEQLTEVLYAHDGALAAHGRSRKTEAHRKAVELMQMVGIPSAHERLRDYPHQFSGGMRQRIMIAIALACSPRLLIADEPTTALDVTIQAQVLELIASLRKRLGMSVVLITHDLGVVVEQCDRVAVMYAGQIVETGTARQVIGDPRHPYTRGLLDSIPRLSNLRARVRAIEGQVPDLVNLPDVCRFYSRCPQRTDACRTLIDMRSLSQGRQVRCILAEE